MKTLRVSGTLGFLVAVATSALGLDMSGRPEDESISLLTGYSETQKRDCRPAPAPKVLPAAGALVDIGAVHRAIVEDSVPVPPAGMTFSLRFANNGRPDWVEPVTGSGAPPPDPRLQGLIARHVRLQLAAKDQWSVRLKIMPGDTSGYEVSRSEFCPVERIANRAGGVERVSGIATMDEINEMRNAGEARVVVDVSATGRILRVALVQGSGSRIADELALSSLRDASFRPALLDGLPVNGQYEHKSRTTMR